MDGAFRRLQRRDEHEDFAYTSGNSFLTGVAYNDTNGNGMYAPGEGLAGVTINAVRHGDDVSNYTTTWSSGGFTLPPGPRGLRRDRLRAARWPTDHLQERDGRLAERGDRLQPLRPRRRRPRRRLRRRPPRARAPTPAQRRRLRRLPHHAAPTPTQTPSPTPTPTAPGGTSPATSQQTGTGSNGGVPGWPSPLECAGDFDRERPRNRASRSPRRPARSAASCSSTATATAGATGRRPRPPEPHRLPRRQRQRRPRRRRAEHRHPRRRLLHLYRGRPRRYQVAAAGRRPVGARAPAAGPRRPSPSTTAAPPGAARSA